MAKPKATTTKKRATKKPVVTKRVASKKATTSEPFMQFRVTQQTLYWVIFGAVAIAFALWIYSLDAKVRDLYDQVDANHRSMDIQHREIPTAIEDDSQVVEEE